jgi:hypothetical protein
MALGAGRRSENHEYAECRQRKNLTCRSNAANSYGAVQWQAVELLTYIGYGLNVKFNPTAMRRTVGKTARSGLLSFAVLSNDSTRTAPAACKIC